MRLLRRTLTTTLTIATAAGALTACGSSNHGTLPPMPSQSAGPITKAQAFKQAKASLTAYDKASTPIWNAGKVTPHAKQVLSKYWVNPNSVLPVLHYLWVHEITSKGPAPKVLSAAPTAVTKDGTGSVNTITIRECLDTSKTKTFQAGKPTKHTGGYKWVRVDTLEHQTGSRWMLTYASDTNMHPPKARSCNG